MIVFYLLPHFHTQLGAGSNVYLQRCRKGKKEDKEGRKERGLWGMAGYLSLEAGKGRVGPHILRNPSSLIFPGWTEIYKDFP